MKRIMVVLFIIVFSFLSSYASVSKELTYFQELITAVNSCDVALGMLSRGKDSYESTIQDITAANRELAKARRHLFFYAVRDGVFKEKTKPIVNGIDILTNSNNAFIEKVKVVSFMKPEEFENADFNEKRYAAQRAVGLNEFGVSVLQALSFADDMQEEEKKVLAETLAELFSSKLGEYEKIKKAILKDRDVEFTEQRKLVFVIGTLYDYFSGAEPLKASVTNSW